MEVDCVYTGPDGLSRIGRVKLPMMGKVVAEDGTESWGGGQGGSGWGLASGPANSWSDWHPVVHPLLSIVLSGAWEFETGRGDHRVMEMGGLVVFMDQEGPGHRSRVLSEEACGTIGVRIDAVTQANFRAQLVAQGAL